MKLRLIFILLFCFFSFAHAEEIAVVDSSFTQKNYVDADSLLHQPYSTSDSIFARKFKGQFQNKYKTPEFDYTTVKPRASLWQRIKDNIRKILESIFGKTDPNRINENTIFLLKILGITILGVFLYFLLKFLVDKQGNFFFSKRNKKIEIQPESLTENIHEIDFEEKILGFENTKEYRLAIRYQFLKLLKKLSDKNIIKWNPEKTNKDYLNELKPGNLKKKFENLNYIFENVWYGEFFPNEKDYQNFKNQFDHIQI